MTISIITVSYNSENTIERTIKSVLAQTCKDYEYIIVDGASVDRTLEIIQAYEPLFDGRMKWICEPDRGIYDAMNKGIEISIGDLVGIVNSDDWFEPDAVKEMIKLVEKTPNYSSCIFCGSLMFHYHNGEMQLMESNEERFISGMKYNSLNYGAYHPSMFVGKDVYKVIGTFDDNFKVFGDSDFLERCYKSGVRFCFTKAVINNMSDGGASNRMNFKSRIPDKIYSCQKKGYGFLRTIFQVFKYIVKLTIKSLLPNLLIKKIRNYKLTYKT